ncbi:hypothetical protein LXL04_019193 [Taraxacum kok-saghyz]
MVVPMSALNIQRTSIHEFLFDYHSEDKPPTESVQKSEEFDIRFYEGKLCSEKPQIESTTVVANTYLPETLTRNFSPLKPIMSSLIPSSLIPQAVVIAVAKERRRRKRSHNRTSDHLPTLLLLLHTVVVVDRSSHLAAAAGHSLRLWANCEGDRTRRATAISISPQSLFQSVIVHSHPQREGAFYPFQYQRKKRCAKKRRIPPPESPSPPKKPHGTPAWTDTIQQWGREEGIRSRYEIGEPSQASPETDRALEVLIARMERMSLQTCTVSDEMSIIKGNARYLSNQVQNVRDDCNRNEASIEIMRDELNMIRMYNEAQEGRIANLEYRIQNDEHQIAYAESRARMAEEKANTVDQQLTDLMEILVRTFRGN